MKRIVLLLAVFAFSFFTFGQKATDNFEGKWKTDEGVIIEISKTGVVFKGIALEKKVLVLENLKYTEGKWTATVIKPKDGTRVNAEVTLLGSKINILVKKGMMSRTIIWTKA
jgi:uncharacterized protein (DUF2147 family)